MKAILKWLGIGLGGLVVLVLIAVGIGFATSEAQLNQTYEVQVETVSIPTDAESIERGRYVVATIGGCADCHGANLQGQLFIPEPVGPLYAPNLTPGQGGISDLSDSDLVRVLRHGVLPNKRSVSVMPAEDYYYLSDADLGALIAYLRQVPPMDNETPAQTYGAIGRLLILQGALVPPARKIDHTTRPPAPEQGVTVDYGRYLASVACMGCHGQGFSGGPIPGAPPDFPPARNLTPGGNLKNWTEADFMATLRTGTTPEGYQLVTEYMPWKNFSQLTDEDLQAIWLFLQSVPAKEYGNR